MKKISKNILAGLGVICLTAFIFSCKKDNYLKDGGVSTAASSLSTYDYLKNHKYHYFDTTILIIDHFNLKDSVNNAGTFFAFTDFSVNALMKTLNCTTLDDLYAQVTGKLVTQYMFSDKNITLGNATTSAVQYPDWAGDAALAAVKKIVGSYGVYLVNSAPTFSYYTLQYVKINGVLDGSVNAPPDDIPDVAISCQTSGIVTSTGTTMHVLINNALLNKL